MINRKIAYTKEAGQDNAILSSRLWKSEFHLNISLEEVGKSVAIDCPIRSDTISIAGHCNTEEESSPASMKWVQVIDALHVTIDIFIRLYIRCTY